MKESDQEELPGWEIAGIRHVPKKIQTEVWEARVGFSAALSPVVLTSILSSGKM